MAGMLLLRPMTEKDFEAIEYSDNTRVLQVIYGLQILSAYPKSIVAAEHDIIYSGPNDPGKVVSEQDRNDLAKLGWHIDGDANVYARFV